MPDIPNNKTLLRRIASLRRKLAETPAVLKGNLIPLKAKAGGERKPAYQITWKGPNNKTRTLYVPSERLAEAKTMLTAYKKAKDTLEQLADASASLYKINAT